MEKNSLKKRFMAASLPLILTPCLSSIAAPITDPYIVNTYTTGDQYRVVPAMGASGDHMIMYWDVDRSAHFARQYYPSGTPIYTTEAPSGLTGGISSSMDGNGNYVIISKANDGSGDGVFATVFNKYGSVIVNTFRVNSSVTGTQSAEDVAMNRNGDFVVTWSDFNTAGTPGVYVKKFTLNGTPVTTDLHASNTVPSTSDQVAMGIAIDETGNFAVTYLISYQSSSNGMDVWARQYNSNGTPVNNPFRVNSNTAGTQAGADIAMDAYGNYMVTWESYSDGDDWGVYAQRYNSNGYTVGGNFLVNSSITDNQQLSSVAMAADGSSVVTWSQWNTSNPTNIDVYAREFDANGVARGNQFLVSSPTVTGNYWPVASMDACGYYVIAWESVSATTGKDASARRYAPPTPSYAPCLANGMTVSNLSGAQGGWRYFKISVPAGSSLIDIQQFGGSGDADLYVRVGALPTLSQYNFRPYLTGNNERVTYSNPPAGDWYIGVYGYNSFSSVNLNAQYY